LRTICTLMVGGKSRSGLVPPISLLTGISKGDIETMNACRKLQAFFLASLLHPILAFLIGPFGSFILFARVELSFCCIQQFRRLAYLTAPILVTAKCSLKWGASIHRSHSDIRGVCTAPASCFSSQKLNSPSGELLYSYRCASRFF
jgi:hypothetical protein